MKQKFFLYARKSSEAEERQAMSIEAQIHELTELANRENLFIAETFTESKSAKVPGRKEFGRMIEKIQASKEPVSILAWHPDRLARNSIDGAQIIYLIDLKKICGLKFSTFWFEPTPQGLFMLNGAFGQSKYYSDNLSENVKRGNRQKLRRGEYSGPAPVGYVNNFKTKNIEPDPVKSRIIQQFFKEYSEGQLNLHSARHRLSFLGVVNGNGKPFTPYMIYRMLTNVTYIGLIKRNGESYQGSFDPILDRGLFESVQRRLEQRARPKKSRKMHDFTFRGMFKCGECGCSISNQFAKGRHGGIYRYYRCTKKKGKCSQSYLLENKLGEQLRERFKEIAIPDNWAQMMLSQIDRWVNEERKDSSAFAQKLEARTTDIEGRLDKLITTYLDGDIEKESYLKRKNEIMKIKVDLHNERINFGRKPSWIEPLRDWVKTIHHAGKLASFSSDLGAVRSLAEKIGTKRLLLDKKILFDFVPPYHIVPKYKALQAKSPALAGRVGQEISNEHLLVRRERDSNPRWFYPSLFSRQVQSTALPSLQ